MILLYHMIWFVMSEFWSKNCSRPMMAMAYESPDLYSINNMIGALANTPKWKEAVAASRRWWAMKKTPPPEKSLVVWWICWDMLICCDFIDFLGIMIIYLTFPDKICQIEALGYRFRGWFDCLLSCCNSGIPGFFRMSGAYFVSREPVDLQLHMGVMKMSESSQGNL